MAKQAFLDKMICYAGILVGVFGILFSAYMFFVLGDAVDALHQTAISQADSAINILIDAKGIASTTSDSMDSLTSFAKNSSVALGQSADSLASMGAAISSLSSSLEQIPFMPAEATGSLESAAQDLSGAAEDMQDTASSMGDASDSALSTASGVSAMEDDIGRSIASLEDTKKRIDGIHSTARLGLLLGTMLAVLMFGLNALSFYRQLRGAEKG